MSYSSILKQQSKPIRRISTKTDFSISPDKLTITESTSTPNKETRDISLGFKCYGVPLLERWLPSSKAVTIVYKPSQSQMSSAQSKRSTKLLSATKAVTSLKTM